LALKKHTRRALRFDATVGAFSSDGLFVICRLAFAFGFGFFFFFFFFFYCLSLWPFAYLQSVQSPGGLKHSLTPTPLASTTALGIAPPLLPFVTPVPSSMSSSNSRMIIEN
jgi:hypothetical protein